MAKRKSLSKKVRFEVFKRDLFTCQYCGRKPPTIILECDHIDPVSKGGSNDRDNLITACFDCNRGKSNNELSSVPMSIKDKHEILIEKDSQIVEYNKLVKKIKRRENKEINAVIEIHAWFYPDFRFTKQFKESSIRKFIKELGVDVVEDAMDKACCKTEYDYDALKYFCGICWNKIKGNTYGN